ncbi:DUF1854 domain-containing protein [Halothiobacillus sp. DCM-1]|uniref:cyanophycin metabolism-associated DUF1854 family protein n=1 Tax=Halothiobacillus sp. DCM-1 TaxID=3112558 RepID=UPI00324D218A
MPLTDQRLQRDAFNQLLLIRAESPPVAVTPVRAFALSEPERFIALVDAQGHEQAFIEDLADLPREDAELIRQFLAERELMPEILRIDQVLSFSTPSQWRVTTNRGAAELTLKSEDDIRRLSEGLLITDAHGLPYRIPDLKALDRHSRRLLARFL